MNLEVNTVKINYKLPHSNGVDFITTDKTPEFLAERWAKRAHEKNPDWGWEFIRGHMMAEVRTASREFWAIFRYDMKG